MVQLRGRAHTSERVPIALPDVPEPDSRTPAGRGSCRPSVQCGRESCNRAAASGAATTSATAPAPPYEAGHLRLPRCLSSLALYVSERLRRDPSPRSAPVPHLSPAAPCSAARFNAAAAVATSRPFRGRARAQP
eukprot:356668-Chlamydomonas_euryale.AAC.3